MFSYPTQNTTNTNLTSSTTKNYMIYALFKKYVEKAKTVLFIGNSSLLLKFVFNHCDFGNDEEESV